jgi:outer membrane immunogenic protein
MKTTLSAITVAAVLAAGSAFAADLPSMKAPIMPPPPPPPPMWTGFYVGLNAGYTWGDNNAVGITQGSLFGPFVDTLNSSVVSPNNDGFIGGGQIGYNYQFANSFVAGIEADIQGVADSGNSAASFNPLLFTTTTASKSLDYLGTVRGRLGYLITPTLLVYGTGGLAYGQTNLSFSMLSLGLASTATGAFSDTRVGWTAGGGVEWMFMPNWSAKVEYLYYDLGTVTATGALNIVGIPIGAVQATSKFQGHVVRAGVNYHFNMFAPAPVVAKY